jgi:membrane protease YdiL (CAAX protease family)
MAKDTNTLERVFLFPVFLFCALSVFILGAALIPNISDRTAAAGQVAVAVFFLTAAVTAYQFPRLKPYWLVFFACFTAAFCLVMATRLGGHGPEALGILTGTPAWMAVRKLSEAAIVFFFVLAFSVAVRSDFASVYLSKGDLSKGLTIGLVTLGVFLVIGAVVGTVGGVGAVRLLRWAPWILVYALSRGFMEELLYRGLFLRRLEPLLGANASNLLTAIVFTMAHTKAAYAAGVFPNVFVGAGITLVLGLGLGWFMQKSESLVGPSLVHAGADVFIAIGIFSR